MTSKTTTEQITGSQDTMYHFQRKQLTDVPLSCPPKKTKFIVWVTGVVQPHLNWVLGFSYLRMITQNRVLLGKCCFLGCLICCFGFLSSVVLTGFYIKLISHAILTAKIKISSCHHEKVYLIIKWAGSKIAQRCLIIIHND